MKCDVPVLPDIVLPSVVYKHAAYPTDLRKVRSAGVLITKLGGVFQLLSLAMDTLFRNRLNESVLMELRTHIKGSEGTHRNGISSLIYVFAEDQFDEFCAMAAKLRYSEQGYSENVLKAECWWTSDERFPGVPFCYDSEAFDKYLDSAEQVYDPEQVYFLVLDSESQLMGKSEKSREYIFYIPTSNIMEYE